MNAFSRLMTMVAGLELAGSAWSAEPGLVAHYNFDEGAGPVLRDVSGHGNDGQIDEVKVYSRALLEAEVKARFDAGVKDLALAAAFQPVSGGKTIRQGRLSVRVGSNGQVQVTAGKASHVVASGFSFPGERIGWNSLSGTAAGSEATWVPRLEKVSGSALAVEARGDFYRLRRLVRLENDRVRFEDTLTNLRREPTGFAVRTALTAPTAFRNAFTPGGAENPTLYVVGESGGLGVLAEDNLSRLRFEPSLGLPANQARFQVGDFALDAGKSHTLRWSIYLLDPNVSYFDFVNRVRRDWESNFTLDGPFAFFDIGERRDLLGDPARLKAYLQRKRLGVVGLSPWLDYDPGTFVQGLERVARGRQVRPVTTGGAGGASLEMRRRQVRAISSAFAVVKHTGQEDQLGMGGRQVG